MDPKAIMAFVLIVVIIFAIVLIIFIAKFVKIWMQAWASNADIKMSSLIGMWFRKVNAGTIVNTKIAAIKAGIMISTEELESLYLAGGDVMNVVRALIAADKANITLNFKQASGIDLAGRDIFGAVQTSVNPKVIDAPDPAKGRTTVDAVAMDGIQLKAKARVTVRTNLDQLVGGATEETIIARVGEGIVTTIGSAQTHKHVLENPDSISQKVLAKGLDAGSAFEILSIDIADIDVGENIGARLQADQAEADKRVAQAKAEERRAMAVAVEQEMKARVQEMRAKVVESEAEVPKAMAEAFRSGNLGIMDYYKMKNINSDTSMRNSIAGPGQSGQPDGK